MGRVQGGNLCQQIKGIGTIRVVTPTQDMKQMEYLPHALDPPPISLVSKFNLGPITPQGRGPTLSLNTSTNCEHHPHKPSFINPSTFSGAKFNIHMPKGEITNQKKHLRLESYGTSTHSTKNLSTLKSTIDEDDLTTPLSSTHKNLANCKYNIYIIYIYIYNV